MCKLRSTLDELTGWLASLDLRKPHASRVLSHQIASQNPPRLIFRSANTYGSLIPQVPTLKEGSGRGQPINVLVIRKRDLPLTQHTLTTLCYKGNPTG